MPRSADGTPHSSKLTMKRYEKEKGSRSKANALEGKGGAAAGGTTPKEGDATTPQESVDQQAPGAGQQRARELHMTFDDAGGNHHVHAVHEDGTEEHTDHATREDAMIYSGKKAQTDQEAYDERARKHPKTEAPDADDYDVEQLDAPTMS